MLAWAVVSTAWLVNSYRTKGVDDTALADRATSQLVDDGARLRLVPADPRGAALVFLCGAGVARGAEALADTDRAPVVVAGHSRGAALACRVVDEHPGAADGLALLGTTHPRRHDLSGLAMPVTKVIGTRDGVAPPSRSRANRPRLPPHTRFVEIDGGNHAQFAHYGPQLFDGDATISRETRQAAARDALAELLASLGSR